MCRTNHGTGLLRGHEVHDAAQFPQRPGLVRQAREVQPGRRVGADRPVQGEVGARLVETVVCGPGQERDERLQILAAVVGQHIVEGSAIFAQDRRHARRVVGVGDTADVGDGFHEAETRVRVFVAAFGELDGVEFGQVNQGHVRLHSDRLR
jgi:hypothetical protein